MKIKINIINLLWGLMIVGIVLLIIGWGWQYQKMKNRSETELIMAKISQYMLLPEEIPTVATVIDKNKLGDQAFFKNALDGDKVLIFPQAGQAILYRPSSGKVVDKTVISEAESLTEDLKIKVAIYNGSGKVGMATKLQSDILDKIDTFEVTKKIDAKNLYPESLVVDISGNFPEVAQSLAQSLGGKVAVLPREEIKAAADLLIIVGQNWQ